MSEGETEASGMVGAGGASAEGDAGKQLRALVEITRTFAEATTQYDRLLQTVVEQIGRFSGGYCSLGLVSDDGAWWDAVGHFDRVPGVQRSVEEAFGTGRVSLSSMGITSMVLRTGRPLVVHSPLPESWAERISPAGLAAMERLRFRSVVCVPLRLQGKAIGTVLLMRHGDGAEPLSHVDLEMLQILADHAAMTISNARLLASVTRELEEHKRTREALERSEDKLRQSQKMEAVGRLAGGVAHDFNNILSVVLSYCDILIGDLRPGEPIREDLEEIQRAGRRAADLTRQLLAFSRQQILAPRVLNLNKVITGIEKMLRRLLGEDVELRVFLGQDLHPCKVDPGQMEQIIINLAVNARDAMPQGGQLTIETGNAELDEAYVLEHPEATAGPHAVISVTDTGVGMDRATMTRIFEPFFTTKPKGVGTGLGLSTVYGIVKQSGGCVWVYSEVGKGHDHEGLPPARRPKGDGPGASLGPGRAPRRHGDGAARGGRDAGPHAGAQHPRPRGLSRDRGEQRRRGAAPLRAARRAHPHAPHRCGDAAHERSSARRAAAHDPPGPEGALHVRLHGERDRAPRRARLGPPFPPEADHARGLAPQGPRGPQRTPLFPAGTRLVAELAPLLAVVQRWPSGVRLASLQVMQSNEIHPGDIIAGKYRVRAILGRNHGLLVDAFHTEFDQRVVLKVLLPGAGDSKEIERFRREARTLAKLSSEHAARIIDVGAEGDGSFYLVREYLEGTDLARYVRTQGALAMSDAVLLILQAAEAVAETHSHGIIVREIQPSTLFLTQRPGGAPLVKLIDFGTAKLMSAAAAPGVGAELTATAMFGLSPYSSPEMIRKAKSADGRTDVWSLGAILYELLTGKPPFIGEAAMLMLQITREEPPPPSVMAAHLPHEIDQVIAWALAKDVDARFKNVYAFAHALRPFAPPEGQLLVDRIGQITEAAKRKPKAASLPPPAVPPPRGSQGGTIPPPRGSQPAPPLSSHPRAAESFMREYQAGAPLDPGFSDETTARVAPGMLAAPKPHIPTIPPPRGSQPGSMDPNVTAPLGASTALPPPPALPSAPPPAPLAAPSSPPPSGFAASSAPKGRGSASSGSEYSSPDLQGSGPSAAYAGAPRKPADRRLVVGVLAAAAVLLPALVAILVMSARSKGNESGEASTSTAVSVPLPATTPEVVVPVVTATATAAPVVTATATASDTAPAATAPLATEDPGSKKAVTGGSGGTGTSVSKPVVKPDPPVVKTATPVEPPPSSGGTGTLMAVALGGSCAFSVNGSSKGSGSSIKVTLPPGTYSVMCKPSGGAIKSKSITVKSGATAMATFKL